MFCLKYVNYCESVITRTDLVASWQRRDGVQQLCRSQVDDAQVRSLVQEVQLKSHKLRCPNTTTRLTHARILDTHTHTHKYNNKR